MMKEWRRVLREHGGRYALLQPRDAVKLTYQSTFGGGHMITDLAACANWIENEKQTAPFAAEAFEDIGSGRVRLHLGNPAVKELPSWVVAAVFAASARHGMGTSEDLEAKLAVLREETANGAFGFSLEELDAYLNEYKAAGCPAVHHSDAFREAYAPAYRVIDARYAPIWPLLGKLAELEEKNGRFTLAMDGMAASGKSTAAELLWEVFGGCVVHMDDFFLPPALRSPARFEEAGGNVHYERCEEEVMAPLRAKAPFTYRLFDCSVMDIGGFSDAIDPAGNVIIEGSYSLHPVFGALPGEEGEKRHPADIAVFLRISPETQRARILQRNGEEMLQMFVNRWIPLENAYYTANRERLQAVSLDVE